jgi:ankyrin repeat protein
LIELGCAVNCGDSDGKTALHYACQAGKVHLVKLLLESQEIDIHVMDARGVHFCLPMNPFMIFPPPSAR